MSIRDKPTHLSYDVWRVLKILSKSESSPGHIVSVDEIADRILGHALAGVIPVTCDRLALQDKTRDAEEKKLVEELQKHD